MIASQQLRNSSARDLSKDRAPNAGRQHFPYLLIYLAAFAVANGSVLVAQDSIILAPPQLLPPRSVANGPSGLGSNLPGQPWNGDVSMVPLLPAPEMLPQGQDFEVDESGDSPTASAATASEDDWYSSAFDSLPDTPTAVAIASNTGPETLQFSPELAGWITWLVRQYIPPTYEDTRKWGRSKEVFNGWHISREGLKIETRRKKRTVNYGTWTRYNLQLVDPDHRLKVVLTNLQTTPDNRVHFDATIEAAVHIDGRLSQWQRDIQIISISADADAVVRMTVSCDVTIELNPLRVPPDVSFKPEATAAEIELAYFRVHHISHIGGPLAKHLGTGLREAIEDYLVDYKDKLPEKINRQIAKKQDKLHISMADWLSSNLKGMATPVAVEPATNANQ